MGASSTEAVKVSKEDHGTLENRRGSFIGLFLEERRFQDPTSWEGVGSQPKDLCWCLFSTVSARATVRMVGSDHQVHLAPATSLVYDAAKCHSFGDN